MGNEVRALRGQYRQHDHHLGRRVAVAAGQVLNRHVTEQLGVVNPVHIDESIERCKAQREKIEAACRRAFERKPADRVSLTEIDFAAEPTPPPS
jgi:hypothetical protein